ncbi:hypothetical protein V2I01_30150 [Micromonospora sp. BRA006-A]|nr:hypothetical protein [Micromonospora sp. BRA006-A]
MHQGTLHREGSVSRLTRSPPAVINFSLPAAVPTLPLPAAVDGAGKVRVETFALQKDLHVLLRWAQDHAVELQGLEAGPTRLDDVFRALNSDPPARQEHHRVVHRRQRTDPDPPQPAGTGHQPHHPFAVSVLFVRRHETFAAIGSLGYIAAIVLFTVAAFGLYATAVTTLASRRQNLFLKRLRSTAVADSTILAGLLLPPTTIAVVRVAAILTALAVVAGGPANAALVVLAVLATLAMMIGLALATAGLTNSPNTPRSPPCPLPSA